MALALMGAAACALKVSGACCSGMHGGPGGRVKSGGGRAAQALRLI